MAPLIRLILLVSLTSLLACADEFTEQRVSLATGAATGTAGAASAAGSGGASAGAAGSSGAAAGEPSGGSAGSGLAGGDGGGGSGATGGSGGLAGGSGGAGEGGTQSGGAGGTGGAPVSQPRVEACLLPPGNVCRWMAAVPLLCGTDGTCQCAYGTLCRDERFVGKQSPDTCQMGPCAQEREPLRVSCSKDVECPTQACNQNTHECACTNGGKLCRLQDGTLACREWCDY